MFTSQLSSSVLSICFVPALAQTTSGLSVSFLDLTFSLLFPAIPHSPPASWPCPPLSFLFTSTLTFSVLIASKIPPLVDVPLTSFLCSFYFLFPLLSQPPRPFLTVLSCLFPSLSFLKVFSHCPTLLFLPIYLLLLLSLFTLTPISPSQLPLLDTLFFGRSQYLSFIFFFVPLPGFHISTLVSTSILLFLDPEIKKWCYFRTSSTFPAGASCLASVIISTWSRAQEEERHQ